MLTKIAWHEDHGTLQVGRENVREIELVFNDHHTHFSTVLSNDAAIALAERIINLIGAKVVFPTKSEVA